MSTVAPSAAINAVQRVADSLRGLSESERESRLATLGQSMRDRVRAILGASDPVPSVVVDTVGAVSTAPVAAAPPVAPPVATAAAAPAAVDLATLLASPGVGALLALLSGGGAAAGLGSVVQSVPVAAAPVAAPPAPPLVLNGAKSSGSKSAKSSKSGKRSGGSVASAAAAPVLGPVPGPIPHARITDYQGRPMISIYPDAACDESGSPYQRLTMGAAKARLLLACLDTAGTARLRALLAYVYMASSGGRGE